MLIEPKKTSDGSWLWPLSKFCPHPKWTDESAFFLGHRRHRRGKETAEVTLGRRNGGGSL